MLGRTALFVCLLAATVARPRETPLDLSKIDMEKSDLRASRAIIAIYRDLKRGKMSGTEIKKTLAKIKKSSILNIFAPSLRRLLALSKQPELPKVIEGCSFKADPSSVVKIIDEKSLELCHRLVLDALTKGKVYDKLDAGTLKYIGDNIGGFLGKRRVGQFAKYLKRVRKGSPLHRALSKTVSDAYKAELGRIHLDVIASIRVDADFTSYIHSHKMAAFNEGILFNKEFRQIKNDVYRHLKEEKYHKAKELIAQLIGFHEQNNDFIENIRSRNAFLILARNFLRKKHFETSILINSYVFRISEGTMREKAAFEILFNLIQQKKYDKAVVSINNLGLLKHFDDHGSKLQYWIAYSVEMYGQDILSSLLYRRLIKNNPLSFYSIIAFKRKMLPVDAPKDFVKSLFIARNVASANQSYKDIVDDFQRLQLWLVHDESKFVKEEIKGIFRHMKDSPKKFHKNNVRYIAFHMGEMINKKKKFLYTFKLIRELLEGDTITLDDGLLRLLFPDPYLDKIQKHNLGLDPYLILSLVRQESAFDPKARSSAGARGLMQLMPATARQLKRRVKTRQLKEPDLNLQLGIKYLKRLIDKYDGNLIYALAGYNAGEGKVRQWTEKIFNSDNPLVIIEMIPYRETRNYIKLIYRNFFFYQSLYPKNTIPRDYLPGRVTYSDSRSPLSIE